MRKQQQCAKHTMPRKKFFPDFTVVSVRNLNQPHQPSYCKYRQQPTFTLPTEVLSTLKGELLQPWHPKTMLPKKLSYDVLKKTPSPSTFTCHKVCSCEKKVSLHTQQSPAIHRRYIPRAPEIKDLKTNGKPAHLQGLEDNIKMAKVPKLM